MTSQARGHSLSCGQFNRMTIRIVCLAFVHVLMLGSIPVHASDNVVYGPQTIRYQSLTSLLSTDLNRQTPSCSLATLASSPNSYESCAVSESETIEVPAVSEPVQSITVDNVGADSDAIASLVRNLESQNDPFIIRGNWSATSLAHARNLWSDDYLSARFGSHSMRSVQLKEEASYNPPQRSAKTPQLASVKQLSNWTTFTFARDDAVRDVRRGIRSYAYLHASSTASRFLKDDLAALFSGNSPIVDQWSDPEFQNTPHAHLQCRFSTPGLQSHAHIDSTDNFIAMVSGTKEYILLPPSECARLRISGGGSHARHSQLDWSDPDILQSAAFQSAQAVRVTLNAGEVLYLPAFWIHHISSRGTTSAIQCNQRNKRSQHGLQDLYQCDQSFQERYRTTENVKSAKKVDQSARWPDVSSLFALRGNCYGKALCSDDGGTCTSLSGLPSTIVASDSSTTLTFGSSMITGTLIVNLDCTPTGAGSATRTTFTVGTGSNSATATFVTPTTAGGYTCTASMDSASTDGGYTASSCYSPTNAALTVTCATASVSGMPTSITAGDSSTTVTLTTTPITGSNVGVFNLVCTPASTGTATTTVFTVNGGSSSATATLNTPTKADSYSCQLAVNTGSTTEPLFLSSTCPPTMPSASTLAVSCTSASVSGLPSTATTGQTATLTVTTSQNVASTKVAAFDLTCTSGSTSSTTSFSVAAGTNSATATFTAPSTPATYSCALSVASATTTDSAFTQAQCLPALSPTAASVAVSCPTISASVSGLPSSVFVGQPTSVSITTSPAVAATHTAKFNLNCAPSGAGTTASTSFTLAATTSTGTATLPAIATAGSYSCSLSVDASTDDLTFKSATCPPTLTPSSTSLTVTPCSSATVTGLPSTLLVGATAPTLTITVSPAASATATFNLACTPTAGGAATTTTFAVSSGQSSANAAFNVPAAVGGYACVLSVVSASTSDANFLSTTCPPTLSPTSAGVTINSGIPFNMPYILSSTIYIYGTKLN